jgi:hypothetical protein
MKKIFFILFLSLYFNGYSQQKKDSTVIEWTWNGKMISKKQWSDSVYVFTRKYIDSIYLTKKRLKKKN